MHSVCPLGRASSWTHYRRSMQLSVPVDRTQSGHSSCLFWKLGGGRGCHDDPRPVAGLTVCCQRQCVFGQREKYNDPWMGRLFGRKKGIMRIKLLSKSMVRVAATAGLTRKALTTDRKSKGSLGIKSGLGLTVVLLNNPTLSRVYCSSTKCMKIQARLWLGWADGTFTRLSLWRPWVMSLLQPRVICFNLCNLSN